MPGWKKVFDILVSAATSCQGESLWASEAKYLFLVLYSIFLAACGPSALELLCKVNQFFLFLLKTSLDMNPLEFGPEALHGTVTENSVE